MPARLRHSGQLRTTGEFSEIRREAQLPVVCSDFFLDGVKLTLTPGAMTNADLAPLRAAGLDDLDILDLNQVTS